MGLRRTISDVSDARAVTNGTEAGYFWVAQDGTWRSMTYQEFQRSIDELAAQFQAWGLVQGAPVGLIATTSIEWEWADKAILKSGGIVVGLEPHAHVDQLLYCLQETKIQALIIDDLALYERLVPFLKNPLIFAVMLQRGENLKLAASFRYLDGKTKNNPTIPFAPPPVTDTDPAVIVFTSGTTGTPKGICYTHGQVLTACRAIGDAFPQINAGLSIICWLPLANLFQRIVNLAGVMIGLKIYFSDNPKTIMDTVRQIEPSFFIGVPRFYEKVYNELQKIVMQKSPWQQALFERALHYGGWRTLRAQEKVPASWWRSFIVSIVDFLIFKTIRRKLMGANIRFCLTGSAPTPLPVLEFFHAIGIPLLEAYALSENVVPMAISRPHAFRLGSVGKILPPNEVKLSPEGEVWVRGPGLFSGYMNTESSAAERVDGFYATGDFGRFDEAQFLYLSGRNSDLIKTSTGRRISPLRVEAVYSQSSYIDQIVVVGQGKSYLSAILTLNRAAVEKALSLKGEPLPSVERDDRSKAVLDLLRQEFERLNSTLAAYEHVRAIAIASEPFSIERGELTASFKLKRQIIAEHYGSSIIPLYEKVL